MVWQLLLFFVVVVQWTSFVHEQGKERWREIKWNKWNKWKKERKRKKGVFYAIEVRPSSTCSFFTPPSHSTYLLPSTPHMMIHKYKIQKKSSGDRMFPLLFFFHKFD
jgi:hypothetical protein